MKTASTLALSAVMMAIACASFSVTANAGRKQCVYMAHNPWTHNMVADGWAKAVKLGTACQRASRRCNRELKRKRRDGAVANDCRKITNLSD